MLVFENVTYLWALVLLPVLVVIYLFWRQNRNQKRQDFGEPQLVRRLVRGYSKSLHHYRLLLLCAMIALLVIAWANPMSGNQLEEVEQISTDVFIALDISNSMLAQDVSPSRLARSKQLAVDLIRQLKGERIGLIYFAGSAFLQMPLTTDYSAAISFLLSASPDFLSDQGTNIADAISLTLTADSLATQNGRLLVILSDGEAENTAAKEKAKEASGQGLLIYTVGAGTVQGAPIPVRTRNGNVAMKRDANGEVVQTRLNELMLRDVATAGKGAYYSLLSGDAILQGLQDAVRQQESRTFYTTHSEALKTKSPWVLWPTFFLLLLFIRLPWLVREN